MARCEDYPCCGHESGCCPDFDPDTGKQLNMKCTCGATVPLTSRSSLCEDCLHPGRARLRAAHEATCECEGAEDDEHEDDCPKSPDYEEDYGDPYDGDREFENYGYDYPSDY